MNDNRVETEQHKAWVSQVYANYHYAGMTQQAAIEAAGPEPVEYEIYTSALIEENARVGEYEMGGTR